MSGILKVTRKENLYEMDFPAYSLKPIEVTPVIAEAIGAKPVEAYMGRDMLCIFDSEDIVKNLVPDMEKVKNLEGLLLQVTARGNKPTVFPEVLRLN